MADWITRVNDMCPAASNASLGSLVSEAMSFGSGVGAGEKYFVDPTNGNDDNSGTTWQTAFATIAKAAASVSSGDWIFLGYGAYTESVTSQDYGTDACSYVKIVGMDSGMGHPFSPSWTSAAVSSPCLTLDGVGWSVYNIKFICPSSAEAIKVRCLYDDNDSYDASSSNIAIRNKIVNCVFDGGTTGLRGIGLLGSPYEVDIWNNRFLLIHQADNTGRAIECTGSSYAAPYRCSIVGNRFSECDGAIDFNPSGASDCLIAHNYHQGTSKQSYNMNPQIDLGAAGGTTGNLICGNFLGGDYSNTGGYQASGGTDDWCGNFCVDTAEAEVGDNGITISSPAA